MAAAKETTPAAAGETPMSPKSPVEAHAKWADTHLGRGGALVTNGVYMATSGATRVAGWTIGDPNLHVRSGLRSLIPMHLRVSARIHHIAFYHPSLDAEFASPQNNEGKNRIGSAIKKTFGWEGGTDGGDKADTAQLVAVLESEQRRLSRDGIVEHHMSRASAKRRQSTRSIALALAAGTAAAAADEDEDEDASVTAATTRGARRFVVASRIPQSAESRKSDDACAPEVFFSNVLKKGKGVQSAVGLSDDRAKQQKYLSGISKTAAGNRYSKSGVGKSIQTHRKASDAGAASDGTITFDEDGVAGDGPLLAALIKETDVAKTGRFLPEVACRVPPSSVGFELRNDQRVGVQSTQPFVVEAPHVIWGGGRDRMFCRVAADGNPLIDARALEYLSNNDLDLAERTESLLCTSATVWVDTPEEMKKDAKSATDVAKHAVKSMEKALAQTAKAGTKGVAKTAATGNKGAKKIKNVFKFSSKGKKSKGTRSAEEEKVVPIEDDEFVDAKERPSLEKVPGKVNLTGRKTVIDQQEMDRVAQADKKETKGSDKGGEEKESQETLTALLSHPKPYALVLDDVLDFCVVGFPSSNVMATFPISVASVLNSRSLEDRLDDPLRPSDLTVTLVQEPSIEENQWGVEVKVTFRVAEVKPNTPLAVEKPELDEEGRWSKSNVDKRLKRLGIHLKNVGKSREEIEDEIRAVKEKEEAEEEALEAAIVAAGLGKGYEQGAPSKEIVRRQMFYDPERESVRRIHRQYGSKDIEPGVLADLGLHSSSALHDNVHDKKQSQKKIPSHIFASESKEGDAQGTDTSLSLKTDYLSTSVSKPPRGDAVITSEGNDSALTTEPSSSEVSETFAASVAEGDAFTVASELTSSTSPEASVFMSAKDATLSSVIEGAASAAEESTKADVFLSAKESISAVKRLDPSSSASKVPRVNTLDLDSDGGTCISKRISSHSFEQDALFKSAAQSMKQNLGDMSEVDTREVTLERADSKTQQIKINAKEEGCSQEADTPGRTESVEDETECRKQLVSALSKARMNENTTPLTHRKTVTIQSTAQIQEEVKLWAEGLNIEAPTTSDVEGTLEADAATKPSSRCDLPEELEPAREVFVSTMEFPQRLGSEMSLKESEDEMGGSNIEQKKRLSASQSRKSRRRSVQSLALMQLSLGSVKGLVGEDLDIFRQSKEGSSEGDGEVAEASGSAVDNMDSTLDRRPDKVLASWAFAFTEHFLEEFPGLLLGLCTVSFVLVVRWSFFTPNVS